jgi:hypothetical protein
MDLEEESPARRNVSAIPIKKRKEKIHHKNTMDTKKTLGAR